MAKDKATEVTKAKAGNPEAPLWQRIRDLEDRRRRLKADLDATEAVLLKLSRELEAGGSGGPAPVGKADTFTARVLALFDEYSELKARDVVLNLGLPVTEGNMDRAKRTLKKLHDSGRIKRSEPGLYEGA